MPLGRTRSLKQQSLLRTFFRLVNTVQFHLACVRSTSASNVYTEYADPKRTEWITKIQPALKKPKLEVLVEACGKRLCRREIIELRAGRKKPHRGTQQLLESILKRLGFL